MRARKSRATSSAKETDRKSVKQLDDMLDLQSQLKL